jgi:hypothetical protein
MQKRSFPVPSVEGSQERLLEIEMGTEKRRFKTVYVKTRQGAELIIAF